MKPGRVPIPPDSVAAPVTRKASLSSLPFVSYDKKVEFVLNILYISIKQKRPRLRQAYLSFYPTARCILFMSPINTIDCVILIKQHTGAKQKLAVEYKFCII